MKGRGVSSGIATVTGRPAAAPYAASAPAAFPAEGAASARAPSALAIDTATDMPRALNDPVGLRDSSLIQRPGPMRSSGVNPSASVTAADASSGSTRAYRHSVGGPAGANVSSA